MSVKKFARNSLLMNQDSNQIYSLYDSQIGSREILEDEDELSRQNVLDEPDKNLMNETWNQNVPFTNTTMSPLQFASTKTSGFRSPVNQTQTTEFFNTARVQHTSQSPFVAEKQETNLNTARNSKMAKPHLRTRI